MTTPEISVQLYTVRDAVAEDREGTFARLHAMGVRTVEGFAITQDPTATRAALDAAGLRMPTAHSNFLSEEIRFGEMVMAVPPLEESLDAAQELGVEVLIDPMVSPERWASMEEIKRTAQRLNEAAGLAAERDITVGYHNHSMEFHHRFDGAYALERFADLLDPEIMLEVDVFWAAIGGTDVPELLRGLGDRIQALHVKDGIIGVDPFSAEHLGRMDVLDQRAIGTGELDFAAILESAPHAQYAVIEFDTFEGDIFEAISNSYTYLKGLGAK